MTGFIFTGGNTPDFSLIEKYLFSLKDVYIIAADSGLDYCAKNGIVPDLIVGDMDSIKNREILKKYKSVESLVYPEDKDDTDTELALKAAEKKHCREIVLIGGGEGRLDHTLAIYGLFLNGKISPDRWITCKEECMKISGPCEVTGRKNDVVSFFSVGITPSIVETSGLKWPLDELKWKSGEFGISNRLLSDSVYLNVKKGTLLGIKTLYEGCIVPGFRLLT